MIDLSKKKVLVVDDDQASNWVAVNYLQKIGFVKENILSVFEGFKVLEAARNDIFDVILMDIRLPGIDGVELSEIIRKENNGKSPKIIAYTAGVPIINGLEEDYKRFLFDSILLKPIPKEIFEKEIFKILSEN